jgi:muramoyltetrapeptide carboxypeptidase LdcA involved in peptidoglycan recycling
MNQLQQIESVTADWWVDRLLGTNINSVTLLATDYLNHFNEVIILIEMVADMPDMIEDVLA